MTIERLPLGLTILAVALPLSVAAQTRPRTPAPRPSARAAAPAPPVPATAKATPPAVPAALCKGRSVLVFEDANVTSVAMDGIIAILDLESSLLKAHLDAPDVSGKLVAGLKAAGCAVEHWKEPYVHVSPVQGKKTVMVGKESKEYTPEHALAGNELDTRDVVVWIRRGTEEHRKFRQGEGLRIDYKSEAEVRARGQEPAKVDANWTYVEDDAPAYATYTAFTADEAARKKAVAAFTPTYAEKNATFDAAVHKAVRTALEAIPPAR